MVFRPSLLSAKEGQWELGGIPVRVPGADGGWRVVELGKDLAAHLLRLTQRSKCHQKTGEVKGPCPPASHQTGLVHNDFTVT